MAPSAGQIVRTALGDAESAPCRRDTRNRRTEPLQRARPI